MEQYWALQMFDSSAKIPYSLLMGNRKILGNYDECIEAEHPNHLFTGQYCLLDANVTFDLEESNPDKEAINVYLQKTPLRYGICVPSSCTVKDIMNILYNSTNDKLSGLAITLDEDNCKTKNSIKKLRSIDWIAIAIFIGFGITAFSSTFYDIYQRFYLKNAKPHQLLTSFSVFTNGKNLFQITQNPEHMKAFDGMRVLSLYWVVLTHSRILEGDSSINSFYGLSAKRDIKQTLLKLGNNSVDTFFFLSGVLVCIVFFRNITKKGYYDVPVQCIHRYIRLTPSLAAFILITVSILINMGDGPIWYSTFKSHVKSCEENWWGEILYISTLFDPPKSCIVSNWYLSTDMQLYWLSPLILFPLFFWPSFAMPFLGIVIMAATCSTFAIAFVNDLNADLNVENIWNKRFKIDYIQFYTRCPPYLIGVATSYIMMKIRTKQINVKLNKVSVLVGWLAATGLCLSVIYGPVPLATSEQSKLENSLYICLSRIGWGLGLAWIVFACLNGYGGPVNKFLSWDFFQPLSKLSYNVYIVHMTVQLYRLGSTRTNTYAGNLETIFSFLGEVVISNLLAILFTLIFEMPFGVLDSYFFRNVKILAFPRKKKSFEEDKDIRWPISNLEETGGKRCS